MSWKFEWNDKRRNPTIVEAILTMFEEPSDSRIFTQVHAHLAGLGLVTSEDKTDRYLKWLIEEDLLVKENGRYKLKTNLKRFELLGYISTLGKTYIEKGLSAGLKRGGTFWTESTSAVLPMFQIEELRSSERYIFLRIFSLMSQMFRSMYDLQKLTLCRKVGLPTDLPDSVRRMFLFSMIFDNLDSNGGVTDELIERYSNLMGNLGEHFGRIDSMYPSLTHPIDGIQLDEVRRGEGFYDDAETQRVFSDRFETLPEFINQYKSDLRLQHKFQVLLGKEE